MIADWDRLRVFHAVAEAGSFTHAGQTVGLSQSALSRQISDLEADLKVKLFTRHARGLLLTEEGEMLYRTVSDMMLKLKTTEAHIHDRQTHPTGELKVTTTYALGVLWLVPLLPEFRQRYPQLSVNLLLDDRELDLSMREADVALRMISRKTDHDQSLRRRHLMYMNLKCYAHKSYLDRKGRPKKLDDLSTHDLLAFPNDAPAPLEHVNWILEAGMPHHEQREAALRVNSYHALLNAAIYEMGIACLPDYMAVHFPDLEVVLPHIDVPRVDVFFAYTEQLKSSIKVTAFRDFLLEKTERGR